jgi:uncharacterized protein YbjT (DUF2867 family)
LPVIARPTIAVLAGATGLVGGACLRELLRAEAMTQVIVLGRRPVSISNPKLRQIITEFQGPVGLPPVPGAAFLCALGTTIKKAGSQEAFRHVDSELPFALADEALRCGAQSLAVVSSVDAGADSPNFYLRVKGEMEEGLLGLGYASVDVFRPSFLMGDRQESRLGEKLGIAAAKALQGMLVGGLSRYKPIEAADVAKAMVRAVAEPKAGHRVWQWAEIQRGVR